MGPSHSGGKQLIARCGPPYCFSDRTFYQSPPVQYGGSVRGTLQAQMLFLLSVQLISSIPISLNFNVTFSMRLLLTPCFKVQTPPPPQAPSPISFSTALCTSAIIHNVLLAMPPAPLLEYQLHGSRDLSLFVHSCMPSV